MPEAEKVRQLRSRLIEILNVRPRVGFRFRLARVGRVRSPAFLSIRQGVFFLNVRVFEALLCRNAFPETC
jgi:hypothetical protein